MVRRTLDRTACQVCHYTESRSRVNCRVNVTFIELVVGGSNPLFTLDARRSYADALCCNQHPMSTETTTVIVRRVSIEWAGVAIYGPRNIINWPMAP